MAAQLNLPVFGFPVESHGSKPVPEPAGTTGSDRFRNHLPNSSTISAGTMVPPKGGVNPGTGLAETGSLAGESDRYALPPAHQGTRGSEPIENGASPVFKAGTGPEPIGISPRLRPYQAAAIAAIEAEFLRGTKRTLAELPTGTGKTVCFAELARRVVVRGLRVLVVAHRGELLKQAARKLADVGVRAGIEQASSRAGRAPVVVASVASLRGDRLLALDPAEFGLVVIDEAHHAAARGYKNITDHFVGVPILGVTATPDRADGVGLKSSFDTVAYRYELRAAIRDQWLVPIRARRVVVTGLDLSQVKTTKGDLDQRELSAALQAESVLHGMVAPLLEQAGSRRTIAFCVDVAHAHKTAELLNRYRHGSARAIDGSASEDERDEVLAAFRRGEFQFLVNCALYTEGFDEPTVACVALLRPTASRALYCQMLGRVTRLLGLSYAESCANGKADGLVLDFSGNTARHRLISPADALAGELVADAIRGDVEAELERGQLNLEEVLAHAEAQVEAKREQIRLLTLAHYRATEIDPFMGPQLPPDPDGEWTRKPATEKQLAALLKAGMKKLPKEITCGEASRYIDAMITRRKHGLCTLKMAKKLGALGLRTDNMTAQRAATLFMRLRRRGWGPWVVRDEPEYQKGKR